LIAVKLTGIVVLQTGIGDDVVILTDPLPPADVLELKKPFNVMVAATPGDGLAVVVSWKAVPLMGSGVSGVSDVKASWSPQTGPANPTENRVNALLETTQDRAHRWGEPEVGVQA
jgi:hypothetical protein